MAGVGVNGRTALVTGAYGLMGAWLVRGLLAAGARVVVLRHTSGARSTLALLGLEGEVSVVDGDVRDANVLGRALASHGVDTVFHLAARAVVGEANRSPVESLDANVRGTWTLLEACRLHGVERVVVASSDKAYGRHEVLPYREDFALRPAFPYEVSKAAADLVARSYWHGFGLPVAVTRCANLYGGGDLNASRVVPEAVSAALTGRRPVIRSDGTPEREFLYVEDAVEAYLALAQALDGRGARGEAFNAGEGRPYAIREVVDLALRVAGADLEPDIRGTGTPHGEIDRQYLDSTKLRELTGWAPRVSLEEGLRRTLEWHRAHPEALAPH